MTRGPSVFPGEKIMLFLAALMLAAPAAASEFQSTAMLDRIVGQFTGHSIGEEGGARTAIDNRLKLANCPAPQLEWRSDAKDAVVVRCMDPAWRIFVAVNSAARPKAAAPSVAVAPAIRAEPVIRRGDAVTVEAGADGFSITREGTAMSDAPAGGRLTIRMDEKKPPVQAVAIEPGRARLPGWGD